jgi:hypothetical protein
MLLWILYMNTASKLGLQTKTLGAALNRGAQADARGATQVLGHGGQAAARGSCLSQVLDRGAKAAARGGFVPCASQVLNRGADAVPTAPLAVRRTYLIVVLGQVLRPLPAATRRCRIRRWAFGR